MNILTKILIAEHDANDLELLHHELKKGGIQYVSEAAINEKEFRNAIKNFIPDLILSDYTFPAFDGPTAFKIKEQLAHDTPFIVVSGTIGEEKSVELIKNGVTDYVLKDKLFTLPVKIKRALKEAGKKREKDNADHAFQKVLSEYQKIMDSSLDVICSINKEGKFVDLSSASERIFGFTPGELKGRKYIDLVFSEDVENTNNAAARIMNGNPVTFFENRYTRKDGSLVPIIWSAKWDDSVKLMYCIAKDATEQRNLARAFETERERFYDLFLQAPSCMGILKGPDHVFEMANPPYLKLINKENILGKALRDVLPEIVGQGFIEILDTVYNTGKPFSANEMLVQIDKEGNGNLTDIYLDFIYQAYKNVDGNVEGIFVFAIDVTEQIISRKKIKESENRFRALVENGTDGVIILSATGNFIYVSPSIERILGYTEEEAMKLDMFSLFHPDQLAGTAKVWQQVMESPGVPVPGHPIQMLHKNGTWRWLEATITNMLHDPSINGIIDNYRDVTERVKTEEQSRFDKSNLDALINNTKDLMWSVDINFKLITCNEPFGKAIMYTSGRKIARGDNVLDSNFSAKQITYKTAYERAFAGESFTIIEYSSLPYEAWSEISYCPIRNSDKIAGVACHSRDITALKANEKIIKDERILLRTLIDNLPAIIYTKDIHSKKTLSNRADYQHLGAKTEEEVLGKDDYWFSSNEIAQITVAEEQQIFYSGTSIYDKEECYKREDKSTAWLLNTKIPLRNQHNEIVGLIGIGYDITERKETEKQLIRSEAFNRGVLSSLSSHIAVIDAAGNIVAVNEAWKQFGIQNGATTLQRTSIGSNYYDVCEKSGEEGVVTALNVLQGMKDVMDEKVSFFHTEYPCNSPNEQRWFSVRVMKFESDEPMIVVAHQNISARKLAEENLLKSESRLLEAQAIAHIGNWEVDLETYIHTWSDEYHNILGITKEEAHPSLEYYFSFIHAEDMDHVKKIIQQNNETINPIPYEFRFIRKDGVIRYGYAQSRFEFDQNNKPIRLFGVLQDVTERKLAEFRLEQQNKELIKTNFELDRFVYSVSHELRAPLTSVLGLVSFIEEESEEACTLEYTRMIKNSVNRLDGLIKNILSYSRNNRTEPEIQEIPVQKSIDEIVSSLYHMKEAEGINFEVNIHEHQPFYSDILSFNTIIENLISNAIKFQKEEIPGRYVRISGHSDKHNLYLRIEDNGIGIAPKHYDNIFKMFFRLSGKTGGSGLGLYIVKEMIEKLQGSIRVNSEYGTGTSFIISLKNLIV